MVGVDGQLIGHFYYTFYFYLPVLGLNSANTIASLKFDLFLLEYDNLLLHHMSGFCEYFGDLMQLQCGSSYLVDSYNVTMWM